MESPAQELLRLAGVDLGLSVALEHPGSPTQESQLRDRQRVIQKRMVVLQRNIGRGDANDVAYEELKALQDRARS